MDACQGRFELYSGSGWEGELCIDCGYGGLDEGLVNRMDDDRDIMCILLALAILYLKKILSGDCSSCPKICATSSVFGLKT